MPENGTKKIVLIKPDQSIADVDVGPGATAGAIKRQVGIPQHIPLNRKTGNAFETTADNADLHAISSDGEKYIAGNPAQIAA